MNCYGRPHAGDVRTPEPRPDGQVKAGGQYPLSALCFLDSMLGWRGWVDGAEATGSCELPLKFFCSLKFLHFSTLEQACGAALQWESAPPLTEHRGSHAAATICDGEDSYLAVFGANAAPPQAQLDEQMRSQYSLIMITQSRACNLK